MIKNISRTPIRYGNIDVWYDSPISNKHRQFDWLLPGKSHVIKVSVNIPAGKLGPGIRRGELEYAGNFAGKDYVQKIPISVAAYFRRDAAYDSLEQSYIHL